MPGKDIITCITMIWFMEWSAEDIVTVMRIVLVLIAYCKRYHIAGIFRGYKCLCGFR